MKSSIVKTDFVRDGANTDSKGSKIMSLNEACEYLDIARPTMYKYLSTGVITGFKYEGSRIWKFDKSQLDVWLDSQMKRGQS